MSKKRATSIPGIYLITNTVTGTVYVGQAVNIRKRWEVHRSTLAAGKHGNRYLQRAWTKYGADAFQFSILRDLSDAPEAARAAALNDAEIEALASYQDVYNLMEAGLSGHVASAETRALLSAHHKAQWADPEARARRIDAIKAATADPAFRALRSEQSKAIHGTPEARAARSIKTKALWATAEHRAAMSERRKANWSDPAYRAKQAESRRKTWEDPEVRQRRLDGLKLSATPEVLAARKAGLAQVRDRINANHRIKWQDPEYRARQSASRKEGQKTRYADPSERAKQSEIAKAMWARRKAEAAD